MTARSDDFHEEGRKNVKVKKKKKKDALGVNKFKPIGLISKHPMFLSAQKSLQCS